MSRANGRRCNCSYLPKPVLYHLSLATAVSPGTADGTLPSERTNKWRLDIAIALACLSRSTTIGLMQGAGRVEMRVARNVTEHPENANFHRQTCSSVPAARFQRQNAYSQTSAHASNRCGSRFAIYRLYGEHGLQWRIREMPNVSGYSGLLGNEASEASEICTRGKNELQATAKTDHLAILAASIM